MTSDIKCNSCNGETKLIHEEGTVRLMKCTACGNEFSVRIHHIEDPIALSTKVYKAYIDASDDKLIRKLQMKAKLVFEGYTNFYIQDLEQQVTRGAKFWDLGFYSEQEIDGLLQKAEKIGLKVNFLPI